MEDERRWDAENCRMRCGKLSYGECITELAKSHFHQWRKYFQRRQSSLGVLLFPCNPWLFSRGICSKLFSLHLTRSFELRKLYILLWIWRMRKRYQVECEHSVRFWFEYLISGTKSYPLWREHCFFSQSFFDLPSYALNKASRTNINWPYINNYKKRKMNLNLNFKSEWEETMKKTDSRGLLHLRDD